MSRFIVQPVHKLPLFLEKSLVCVQEKVIRDVTHSSIYPKQTLSMAIIVHTSLQTLGVKI